MSASEAGAVEAEPIDRAEHGRGDLFGAEEFLRKDLHLLAGDRFNRSKNLVERIIAAEIELLASKVGHAGTGGLKRKHERSLEMILGAEQLFRANRGFFHGGNSARVRSRTSPMVSFAVPAHTLNIPVSEYGVISLNTA